MTFDPRNHLKKITAKGGQGAVDYLPPKWRAKWFREDNPKGTILTEICHFDEKVGVVKATVTKEDGTFCTSYGHETAADHADYLMKAETKAIGRALSILGYGIEFSEEDDDKEAADPKSYEVNQANTVAPKAPPMHPGATKPAPNVAAMVQQNGGPLTPDMPEGADAAQLREWFLRRLKTIKPLKWPADRREGKPQALAIELKKHGVEANRPDMYEWLTGVKSAKEMSDEQIYLLEANAHRTKELTACAEAMREERAKLSEKLL